MSIKHFRIDDRLIHGQIITVWIQNVNCNEIVIADDKASEDPLQQSLFNLAVPKHIKLKIFSIEKAVMYLNKYPERDVFLIVRNLETVCSMKHLGLNFDCVNIGNISPSSDRKKYTKSVWLNDDDIYYIQKLQKEKVHLYIQVVPSEHIRELDRITKF